MIPEEEQSLKRKADDPGSRTADKLDSKKPAKIPRHERLIEKYSEEKNPHQPNPEETANFFSRLLLFWVSPLVSLGNLKPWMQSYHPRLATIDSLETNLP